MNRERTNRIVVEGIAIDIERKHVKHLRLTVYPSAGRVRASCPVRLSDEALSMFIVSKMEWIKKHFRRSADRPRVPESAYVSGERHFYRGKPYVLQVHERPGVPRVVPVGGHLALFVRTHSTEHDRARVLAAWYRTTLQERVSSLIRTWEPLMGVGVESWNVRRMRTRWGSCNIRTRSIRISTELAARSDACLEYVVVHEMTHLLERKHNARFKALMDTYIPGWKSLKDELNRPLV